MNERNDMQVGTDITLCGDTWRFAQAAQNFDEHIAQSVPYCQEQRAYIASLARFFLHEGALAYELGVSTGRTAQAVLSRVQGRNLRYVGIDLEAEMVAQARANLAEDKRFSAVAGDVQNFPYEPSALVISYYTLQFLPPGQRPNLLRRLYENLEPGGALVLYEKTLGADSRVQDAFAQIYHEFKTAQGLGADAILNKERALQGVARPWTLEDNRAELQRAGFDAVEIVFRAYCFAGFLALKGNRA